MSAPVLLRSRYLALAFMPAADGRLAAASKCFAREIGHRAITVNSILPTAIDGAGVFTELPSDNSLRKQIIANSPMGRLGTVNDVADAAEYVAGQLSSFVSGQHLLLTGGAALNVMGVARPIIPTMACSRPSAQ